MDWFAVVKWIFSRNVLMVTLVIIPGWGAMGLSTYVYAVTSSQVGELTKSVSNLRRADLEERLDKAYTAQCMLPGDSDIRERIRDLQREYEEVTGRLYPEPDCRLLMKLVQ